MVCAVIRQARQNTTPTVDCARPWKAAKKQQTALRGHLSLDNRGPHTCSARLAQFAVEVSIDVVIAALADHGNRDYLSVHLIYDAIFPTINTLIAGLAHEMFGVVGIGFTLQLEDAVCYLLVLLCW
jgi:hypothetical protein